MQIWKSTCLHIKITCGRFHIITAFTFWVMRTRDIWNISLQTYRNNTICQKVAYIWRKIETSRVNNSRIFRIKNAKFSGYWFYTNPNIYRLLHLMRVITRTHASTRATSLMRAENSTRHFCLWYLLSGTLEWRKWKKDQKHQIECWSLTFVDFRLNVVLSCMTSDKGRILNLEWIL